MSDQPKLSAPERVWVSQAAAPTSIALSTRTSPPPTREMGASGPAPSFNKPVQAVFISIDLVSAGIKNGLACSSRAAEPVTIGAAPDVPPEGPTPVPGP